MTRRLPFLCLVLGALVCLAARPAGAAVPPEPSDEDFGSQQGLKDIKAPQAWSLGTGAGIRVAVVSTGIATGHPDLTEKTDGGTGATDCDGRGTHLAGIVGAATNNGRGIAGVAPDARLLPFRAFESDDSTIDGDAYLQALAEAGNAAQVVLVDLPGGFPADKGPQLRQLLQTVGGRGVSVVVGAQSAVSLAGLPVLPAAGSSGQAGPQGVVAPDNVHSTTVASVACVPTNYGYDAQAGSNRSAALAAGAVAILRGLGASSGQAADLLRATKSPGGTIDVAAAATAFKTPPPPKPEATTTTKKAVPTPTTKGSPLPTIPNQPGGAPSIGAGFGGEVVEPGEGEAAVVPPGAEEFYDSGGDGDTGGRSTLLGGGDEDDRPLGALAVGFGLLCGVGTGLSVTLRRLAGVPL